MEVGSLPIVQEPLVPTKGLTLAPEVKAELDAICKLGLLAEGDLDTRAIEAIKDLDTSDALAIFEQFKAADLSTVGNKSTYICTLIKSRLHKNNAGVSLSGSGGDNALTAAVRAAGPSESKLKEILERTKYSHEVTAGQRKYGGPPPEWTGPQPGNGHEIYCGKLPKDVFEDTLIPMFEKYGTIWDMRLMMDPISGRNRGYCFVTYTEQAHARDAIDALNGFEIRPNRPLRVNASVANVRLFVGNIPKNRSREEIKEEFEKHTEGLVDVIVYNSPDDTIRKNRGFAFLDYDSHKSASAAKRIVGSGRVRMFGSEVFIDWAEPQDEPDEDTMAKVKVLYIRNLKSDVTEVQLKEMFESYGTIERAKRVKSYGFVHFAERESAVKAMEALNGTKVDGLEIEISLAKPLSKNRKNDRRRYQQYGGGYNQGTGYHGGGGYNGGWGQPAMGGYYAGGAPGWRANKEYEYYGYDNNYYAVGDYYGGGYDAQGYAYYGGAGGAYGSGAPRKGRVQSNQDSWYGNGSYNSYSTGGGGRGAYGRRGTTVRR